MAMKLVDGVPVPVTADEIKQQGIDQLAWEADKAAEQAAADAAQQAGAVEDSLKVIGPDVIKFLATLPGAPPNIVAAATAITADNTVATKT